MINTLLRLSVKQISALLLGFSAVVFLMYGIFSDSEEEALTKDVTRTLNESEMCLNNESRDEVDCKQVLTRILEVCSMIENRLKEDNNWKNRLIDLYTRLGRLSNKYGDFDSAVKAYEKLTYYDPQKAYNYGFLARSLLDAGRPLPAVKYARLAIQLEPHQWRAHKINAQVLEANNDLRSAIESYRTAFSLAPLDEKERLETEIARLEEALTPSS